MRGRGWLRPARWRPSSGTVEDRNIHVHDPECQGPQWQPPFGAAEDRNRLASDIDQVHEWQLSFEAPEGRNG